MFRRTATHQDVRSNPFISSNPSLASNSTQDLPTITTTTDTNISDEEAHQEKPSKKTKKPKRVIPARKASPPEIRAFFAKLLTERDSSLADDESRCDAIVSAWKIGSGVEMRQYGSAMYLEMFGREYGWILYREVKSSVRKETNVLLRRPLYSFLISSFLIEVVTISLLVHFDMDEGVEVVVILTAVVGMLTLLVSLIILCAGNSPARLIERDLKACTKAMAAAAARV